MTNYYKNNREARLAYGKKYYRENKTKIRIYQNNYHRRYYYKKKFNIMIDDGRKENHKIYLKYQANLKKKKERKLMRKYFKIWYKKVFGERDEIRREMFIVHFD